MNDRDQAEYVADGLSFGRREQFHIAEQACRAWEVAHPWSLDDYFDFL